MKDFLTELMKKDIHIVMAEGELSVKFPKHGIDKVVLEEIRSRKQDIIAYLNGLKENAFSIIPALSPAAHYPISNAQRRLWVLSQFEEGSVAYNIPGRVYLEQDINIKYFKKAIDSVIGRHEILRTVFRPDESGEVRQWVLKKEDLDFKIDYKDLRQESDKASALQHYIKTDSLRAFDLVNGPLLRAALLQVEEAGYVFYYNMHHIISDGWSIGIVSGEVLTCYEAYKARKEPELKPLRIQYRDYSAWQLAQLEEETYRPHKEYWLESLKGELPLLDLPALKQRPRIKTYNGYRLTTYINAAITGRLKEYAQDKGGSLFIGLLTAWNVLMYRYTSKRDFITGTPMAGREHADLEEQIGFYVNTLALRNQIDPENSFDETFAAVRKNTLEAYSHQMYPFDQLVEDLNLHRDTGRSVVFDVMLILQNNGENRPGITLSREALDHIEDRGQGTSKFDMAVTFQEMGDYLSFELEYNPDVYEKEIMEALVGHYRLLLAAALSDPGKKIADLDYLQPQERQHLLVTFNNTETKHAEDKTLAALFEQQVNKTPDAVALVAEEQQMSYRELNEQANKLADYLKNGQGITAGDRVGISLERPLDYVVALFGIQKASCCCVPLNPELPEERFAAILPNLELLVDNALIDKFRQAEKGLSGKNPLLQAQPEDLAYIIYTSGSTGVPKGVMIEHRGIVNHLYNKTGLLNLNNESSILNASKMFFVGAIWQLWAPLVSGGKVILPSNNELQDISVLLAKARQNKVRILEVIPSQISNLIHLDNRPDLDDLETLILTGEPLKKDLIETIQKLNPRIEIINTYGQTECSDVTTMYRIAPGTPWDQRLVGKPVQNTSHYIVDENGALCPVGVTGEIWTSGACVGRGYLGQEALTKEKFISDPFSSGKRVYKTGDLGRWRSDGNLEVIGRKDNQVKIRGYRIEPGEIEQALVKHNTVREAVVLARENSNGEKELVAYVTGKTDQDTAVLRSYLKTILPDYMLPVWYVHLDELPLTSNGKVDKRSLPDPEGLGLTAGTVYVAPRNATEEKLVAIWQEILQREPIGVQDDFFALGGHSLKAVRLSNDYQKKLSVRLSLKELFTHTTIEAQAALIQASEHAEFAHIAPLAQQVSYAISDAQRRLWVLSQFEEGSLAYNMSGSVYLNQAIDIDSFKKAIGFVIKRHEILRTVFRTDDSGDVRQWILEPEALGFRIGYKDLRKEKNREEQVRAYISKDAAGSFDLAGGPLLRAALLQVEDQAYVFCYTMHHIISDGWSMEVLARDVFACYAAYRENRSPVAAPLKIQYKDYSAWQLAQLEQESFQGHRDFWLNKLSGELPLLDLPAAKQRPKVKTYKGRSLGTFLNKELSRKLKEYSLRQGGTVFMGLMASLNAILYRYTGQSDLIIGSPVAGRDHADLENQIGFYVNTLALRNEVRPEDCFDTLFTRVKQSTLQAYSHQMYPFDRLVEELGLVRDTSRNAVFDIIMVLQNNGDKTKDTLPEGEASEHITDLGYSVPKSDMDIAITEQGDCFYLQLVYNTDVYEKQIVESFVNHYRLLLNALLENPERVLAGVDYLPAGEREQVLYAFNNTETDYPRQKTLADVFEEQVIRTPQRTAVVFGEKTLNYRELDAQANQLAAYLQKTYAIGPDNLVSIRQERSEWLLISVLGILKAGGAYVPVDPAYPQNRIAYIEQDARCKVCLDEEELEKFRKVQAGFAGEKVMRRLRSDNLAYVIYTSGSTGMPKGVLVEHSGVVNRLLWMQRDLNITEADVFLQKTPVTFDVSVWELLLPLISGSTLVVAKPEGHKDPVYLSQVIAAHKVSIVHFVPSMLSGMLESISWKGLSSLRHVVCSGEALTKRLEDQFKERSTGTQLHNYYGPTEASVDVTAINLSRYPTQGKEVSIGRPVDNTSIYIVNEWNVPQPIGILGEILIGGVQVARGYLNKKELSTERFTDSPFRKGERVYRTGDLGRWMPDGTIEFTGRKDDQVKIRGHRIELGEVEAALNRHTSVEQCIVLAKEDDQGEKDLVAYVIPSADTAFTVRQIIKTPAIQPEFEAQLHEMDNGISMYAYNRSEARFLYKEIFEDRTYAKNGISLSGEACIIDVGANIGAFSIYAAVAAKGAQIYAFEPLPPIYSLLQENTSLYKGQIKVFNTGLSDKEEEAVFDYYPYATVLSGRYSESDVIAQTVRKFISNSEAAETEGVSDKEMEELLQERLVSKKYTCRLKTLSQVILENHISKIDLLKIDVENGELDVLNGISEEDWKKIEQLVIEVHDEQGRLTKIEQMLSSRGFAVIKEQNEELLGTALYDVYASKRKTQNTEKEVTPVQEWYGVNALTGDIRKTLAEHVPYYMVPSEILLLAEMPLTANGKLDRKKLLSLVKSTGKTAALIAPRNAIEKQLSEIWKRILSKENIGVTDDFFSLGGHSIKAARLSNEYQKVLGLRVSLKDLFVYTTIETQAGLLQSAGNKRPARIPELSEQASYAISDAQRRLWVLSQFEGSAAAYTISGRLFLDQAIDADLFEKAIQATIIRHEILRTIFKTDDTGTVRQWIQDGDKINFRIDRLDLRKEKDKENAVLAYMNRDAGLAFDLAKGPLLRAALIRVEDSRFVFYYNMHHIISDGWSMEVLSKDVVAYYSAFKENKASGLSTLHLQYKDYSAWQLAQLEEEAFKIHRAYWLETLKGELPVLDLPASRQRPRIKTYNGARLSTYIDPELTGHLREYSQVRGGSLFMGLLAAWNVLMYRYTAQTDIIIGTPVAGRDHSDLEDQIGFYVNTLALRNSLGPEESFEVVFLRVKQNMLQAYEHQMYPFDRLVEELKFQRDTGRSAVFDISLSYHNISETGTPANATDRSIRDSGLSPVKNDMEIHLQEEGDCLSFNLVYNTDVYSHGMVENLMLHYRQLLRALMQQPAEKIASLNYLTEAEEHKLLVTFNATGIEYPEHKTVIGLFSEQAQRTPDHPALVFERTSLSYGELDRLSDLLAAQLQTNYNIKRGDLVGIQLERSQWMVLALLSVLKAGAAYVPVDPEHPVARKEYMAKDTDIRLLITETSFIQDIDYYEGAVFAIDVEFDPESTVTRDKTTEPAPNDLAYIIYTSGSTGTPKGVMIEHGGLVNMANDHIRKLGLSPADRVLQFVSFSFDGSVLDMFMSFLSGATLVVLSREAIADHTKFRECIEEQQVTVMTVSPVYLKALNQPEMKSVRLIITAGDAAQVQDALFYARTRDFYNAYGPTEGTVNSTLYKVDPARNYQAIPIGAAADNKQVYILSEQLRLQPVGVTGEICVAGVGLARGYLNQEALTQEKFISNPFREGGRLYLTGDLGRWLPDGTIEFAGRKDEQVKIRGYRIELGEIEHTLLKHSQVKEAVVLARENQDHEKELIAYLTSGVQLNAGDLRGYLAEHLPEYMLPAYYVQLDKLPLNANGKINRKALPDPKGLGISTGVEFVAPRNAMEETLAGIWKEVLDAEQVGINDRFYDLGGDSIKVLRIIAGIKRSLNYELPVAEVYNNDTVGKIAAYISANKHVIEAGNREREQAETLVRNEMRALRERVLSAGKLHNRQNIEDIYPMSDIEKGMVFAYIMNEGTGTYHDQIVFRRRLSDFTMTRLQQALVLMMEKHAILRTSFNLNDYECEIQVVHKKVEPVLYYEDISGLGAEQQQMAIQSYLQKERGRPFLVSAAPIWRMSVFALGEENYAFVFQCHHAIIDGWSEASFKTELNNIYLALTEDVNYKPEQLKAAYKDFIVYHELNKRDEAIRAYWKKELSAYERLELFTDKEELSEFSRVYGNDFFTRIEDVAKAQGTTVKTVSLSAYLYMLKILSYSPEIVTGLVTNLRPGIEDGDRILGCFLNSVPLRLVIGEEITGAELVRTVHDKLIELKNHEQLSLLEISSICGERSEHANPFFDVLFNYVDFHAYDGLVMEDQAAAEAPAERGVQLTGHGRNNTFFDFNINTTGAGYGIGLSVTRKLKSELTAEYAGNLYVRILDFILENTTLPLSMLNVLPDTDPDRVFRKKSGVPVETLECSEHQKRLWFIDQFEKNFVYENSPVYHNLPLLIETEENIDAERLAKSINRVADKLEILRTNIVTRDGIPYPVVKEKFRGGLRIHKKRALSGMENVITECLRLINVPFDIAEDELVRFDLVHVKRKDILLITAHHLIVDRDSLRRLFDRIMHVYNGGETQSEEVLYTDFSEWQNRMISSHILPSAVYWKKKLKGVPVLYLETDHRRDHIHVYSAALKSKKLGRKISDRVNEFCEKHNLSPTVFFLGVFNILLHRYTESGELVIGTLYNNRDNASFRNLSGPVANLLTLRTEIEDDLDVMALMNKVRLDYEASVSHADIPFEKVVLDINPEKDMSRTALFDILFHYEPAQENTYGSFREIELNYGLGKYDLNLLVRNEEEYKCYLTYNRRFFSETRMENLLEHYANLVEQVLKKGTEAIQTLDFMTGREKKVLITDFNFQDVAYPEEKTLVDLFEARAETHGGRIALVHNEISLTYQALNEYSNQFAAYLRETYAVKPDTLVTVLLPRSEWLIISLLAVLKSGAAYVPVDPLYPEERISYMISDSGSRVMIDEKELQTFRKQQDKYSKANPVKVNKPGDLAYVIYTSGTTGRSKGSLIEHKNVVRLFMNDKSLFDFNESDVWTMFHSYCFDFSVWEMYGALLYGGSLVIVPSETAKNADAYLDLLKRHKVTVLNQTPSSFYNLSHQEIEYRDSELSLRYVIFGGEALSPSKLKDWKLKYPDVKLINMYGITETTVHVTYKEIGPEEIETNRSNIGFPIPTLSCYVLDRNRRMLPVGLPGELYVGGLGVGRGYLNKPELTGERFLQIRGLRGRLYRSGDKVKRLENGELEYIGRIDDQVKIRGYRIELGEIEHALLRNESIEETVVIARENEQGDRELVAYITSEQKQNTSELKAYLKEHLPEYMIPAYFVQLEALPLTSNGKVDRKALPDPEGLGLSSGVDYVAPQTEAQKVLVGVWSDVLKREGIGIKDSFFNLGGDSIKSIQVVSRLKQKGYTIKVEHILRTPVLEELALLMQRSSRVSEQSVVEGRVELTPVQHWFFEEPLIREPSYFNQSVLLKSKETLDRELLEKSITALVRHHDVLRMIYRKNNDGSWEQRNRGVEANHYRLDFYDLADSSEPAKDINSLGENLQSGLDLEKGPLFRVVHFRLKDGDRLGLILHHLLVDGVSWRILLEDLSTLYSGYRSGQTAVLPLKTDSFQKWAKLQKEYSGSYSAEKERSYWEKLSDQDILPLPQDKESSASATVDSSISFQLDKVSTELLQTRVHGAYNTEINDILLTGLGLALQEVFDRDRAVIRMEGHGREEILEDVDISRTVGWFTSMYPFVLDVSGSASQRAALVQVKESLRKLPGKGIGYGILKYLSQEGLKDSLKAEILFNYLGDFGSNVGSAKSDTAIFDYASESLGATSSLRNGNPVLLDISGMLVFGELSLSLRYSRDKYPTERIRTLAIAYEKHLKALIAELSEEKQKRLTPSDLSFKGLSISELSELNADGNLEDVYELSPLQEGIYYHWLTEDSGMFYFEQMSYRVKASDLEIEKLRRAYAGIVSRHGILRTGFSNRYAGRSLQIVRKAVTDQFSYEKLSGKDAQAYINKVKQSDRERGFDLSGDSQMRLHVIELVAGEYEFIWSHHHILMDGWCMSVLIDDFNQLLSAELKGTAAHLPAVVPYSAYIRWLNKLDKASSLAYWKEELSGYKEVAVVPFRNYPEETGYTSGSERLWIEGDLFKKLTSLCSRTGITQNTFIQGVWGYLLSRYNSTTDVVFGSVVSGRPAELEGVEEMIGLFVNTIPVRVRYAPDNTPAELLSHLQDQSIRSTSHHYVNLSEVQSQSEPGMNLINHILIFENYVVKEQSGESVFNSREGGIFIESAESFERTNYDLNIIVLPAAAGLGIDLVYNSRYYDSGLISRLKEHLHNVIRQFAEASDQPLHALHYLTQEEQEELLNGFNATDCAYSDVTVMELFEAQVKRSPDAPALQFGEETLSYGELNARSNVLAHLLRDHYGVSSSDRVGVMLERSPESVICMIGLMKTGACYVPVDHEYPSERVRYITEDSGIKLMISTGKLGSKHGFKPEQLFLIEEHDPGKGNKENPLRTNALSDGSYVIYTSGSTGQPKGVLQTHRMLSNLIQWDIHHSGIAPGLKHLQYASFSFDASLHDLYFVLGSGGSAYIVKESQRLDYPALKAAILNQKIAVLSMPFSALNAFCTETEIEHWQSGDIRYIVSTAEQLYVGQGLRTFLDRHPGVELHNHYGPSESHVISSHRMSSGQSNLEVRSPIGKPLSNSRIYILDGQRHLVPVGVEGELYLGGHNLAIGYLNKEELTQERFVEDPFRSGEQLYKTGDRGYWRKDGTLVFTGRKDDQVKIRGYRIELGEIEHALQSHEEIEEAVVLAKDNPREEKELVAYLRSRKLQNSTELRGYLKQILPEYMLPLHYVQLDSFPLTGNGKIDKRSLPAPKGLGLSSGIEYIAPRTETEKKLVEIWEMVLQKEHIGIKDDFFALGGNSLQAVKVMSRINHEFRSGIKISNVFGASTIESLAIIIDFAGSQKDIRTKNDNLKEIEL